MKRKLFLLPLLSILLSSSLVGCSNKQTPKGICIMYTTDVHAGIKVKDKVGYSSLYGYKEKKSKTNYVTLVDSGDYLQGEFIGAISKGEYVMEVMNKVKYDIITLGNHEFDYGIEELSERLNEFNGDITSCNFSYIGHKENKFEMVKPYVIKDYGFKKVGFIGVTTPTTLTTSDPKTFIEDDEVAYDFGASSPSDFYSLVQSNIDSCKAAGADYIILLSHLGYLDNYRPYSSKDVLANTSGVTAFLDGHSHADVAWITLKNKNNEDTYIVGAGYKLNEFASLTISRKGELSFEFVNKYEGKNQKIDTFIDEIVAKGDKEGSKIVATTDVDLSIFTKVNDKDIRTIRDREMPIGNLVADGYRNISNSQIAFVNGGGIRTNLDKGEVTYKEIMDVHPFGNMLMKKKTTGQKILDYLEFASRKTQKEFVKDGLAFGENGAFAQVSGLKYTIDTSIPSSVKTTESGEYISIDGPRRVKNVQVLEGSTYVDIVPTSEYIISSHNFLLDSGGDGANMFISDPVIPDTQILDFEILISYIVNVLNGHLIDKYSNIEGRINII